MLNIFRISKIKLVLIIGVLVVVGSLWLIPGPARKGAMVTITPNRQQVQQGYEWQATIHLNANVTVNALDIALGYPADEVQVLRTSLDNSRFETKVFEPTVAHDKHEVYFVQATLQPFTGQGGQVGTITFKAKKPAKPEINVSPHSKIIAHDGKGTNVYQTQLTRSVGEWLVDLVKGKG